MAEEKFIDPYHIELPELVAEKLKQLPESPGVYIMKDSSGKIIYVGKAVVLKNRVRQYFRSQRNHSPKVRAMVSHVADFETIITGSEVEKKKPDPEIYLKGAAAVGEDPADCLVVEDAISGVQAAHAAGMHAAAVPTTFTLEELRERCAPEYELSHIRLLSDLPQLQER